MPRLSWSLMRTRCSSTTRASSLAMAASLIPTACWAWAMAEMIRHSSNGTAWPSRLITSDGFTSRPARHRAGAARARSWRLAFADHPAQFAHEIVEVLELAVDRGEAHVGDLIEIAQLVHHQSADGGGVDLTVAFAEQALVDAVDRRLEVGGRYRALLACDDHPAQDLLAVE